MEGSFPSSSDAEARKMMAAVKLRCTVLLVAAGWAMAMTACTKAKESSGQGPVGGGSYGDTPNTTPTPISTCQKQPSAAPSTGTAVGAGTAPATGQATGQATIAPAGNGGASLALDDTGANAATGTGSQTAGDPTAAGPAETATWSDVKTVIQNDCANLCHSQHDSLLIYGNAVSVAAEMVEYTDLNPGDPNFMPQGGQRISLADREKLILWLAGGTKEDASGPSDDQATDVAKTGASGGNPGVGTVTGQSRFTPPPTAGTPTNDGC